MDELEKISATMLVYSVSKDIVKAATMTSKLVGMACFFGDEKSANAAVKNFYEYIITVSPMLIETKKKIGENTTMDEWLFNQVKQQMADENYTLDEMLKQAGVKTDGK